AERFVKSRFNVDRCWPVKGNDFIAVRQQLDHGSNGTVFRGSRLIQQRKECGMSGVRVLVGTRKGAFVLTSDAGRQKWDISGPHFAGWEIYHWKGSPVDPNRIYASQYSGWFGQMMQRSNDGGNTWESVNNEFKYDGVPGTHQWYDGTPHPWEFKRVW